MTGGNVHAELSAEFYELFEEEREELGDLPNECGRLVRNYLHHWRHEDKLYKTIDTELDEVLELPNGLKIRIIIDKIVEDRSGGIWVVDYKTGKNFLDPDWLILDPQLARYHWSADKLGYTPLRGVIYDEIRTHPPTLPKLLAEWPARAEEEHQVRRLHLLRGNQAPQPLGQETRHVPQVPQGSHQRLVP
jgi:RecB family exonuclease